MSAAGRPSGCRSWAAAQPSSARSISPDGENDVFARRKLATPSHAEPMLRDLKPGEIKEWGICCFQRFGDETADTGGP